MQRIQDKLKNVRTLEDAVNLLTVLFTNLNNQNRAYYDIFLNPEPMDVPLEMYNEKGEVETVLIPNRAKDNMVASSGMGNPNGRKVAPVGSLYIDSENGSLYYKAQGTDANGWVLVWSSNNFVEGSQYLSPTGDASGLTNLNMSNAGSGILPVTRGGSGTNVITGPIRGNGTGSFTAIPSEDYLSPDEFIGMVMFSPVEIVPTRCLICDGAEYNIAERPELTKLCNKLKNKYGGDGVTTFAVPDLINRYIKGGTVEDVGFTEDAHVGEHSHDLSGNVGIERSHTHDPGTLESTGTFKDDWYGKESPTGAFSFATVGRTKYVDAGGVHDDRKTLVQFNLSKGWVRGCRTGEGSSHTHTLNGMHTVTAGEGENDVNHVVMVPVIRY